ncbi:hypothetical protein [Sphingomonas turrisvirgatae]|uniref:TonB C-terminal domain-containing protein n=1 Tax=Sphingomonas turrisvirgatae TaxID=1888892 RepID=A0A1E3LZZ4_9SPHN|nr:hypothetical protein [Sphingomonas turrisvirgatae]ODP39386.1 hypothetical protein BFL28_09865 [Sphingomonas turrisvirgatae]
MSGLLLPLLIAQQAAQPAPVPVPLVTPRLAIDWASLPDLPYRHAPQVTPAMHAYVKAQTRAHRCPVQRRVADKLPAIRIQVAVLVHPEDGVRTSVPHAAGCPVVEQYAAGLVTAFARNNLAARTAAAEQWYRATVTFVWRK